MAYVLPEVVITSIIHALYLTFLGFCVYAGNRVNPMCIITAY